MKIESGDEFPLNLNATLQYGQPVVPWKVLNDKERKIRAKEVCRSILNILLVRRHRAWHNS